MILDLAGDLGCLFDHLDPSAGQVDPEGRQWPRTKRSDDATAVYLVLSDG
jgi:hypothetical protein